MGEVLDAPDEVGAPLEAGGDLGVQSSVASPTQHSALERPQDVSHQRVALGSRNAGQARDEENPVWTAAETAGDIGLADSLIEQTEDPSLDRTKYLWLAHAVRPPFAYKVTSASTVISLTARETRSSFLAR